MEKRTIVLICICLCIAAGVFASDVSWEDISAGNTRLESVLTDPQDPRIIYFGSDKGVFKSEDAGSSWRNILSVRGQDRSVNFLSTDPQNKNSLYAATGNGLYFSSDQGKNWKRIFRGANYLEKECTCLAILPDAIYLGTKSGLFVTKDKGRSWHKEAGMIGKSRILAITYNPAEANYIYAAGVNGVFMSKNTGQNWERVFVADFTEKEGDAEENSDDQDEGERFSDIRYLVIDPGNSNCLYLATCRGVYKSCDKGSFWEPVSDYGLLSKDISFLLVSWHSELYAVSKSGIFKFNGQRWEELSFGLSAEEINFITLDRQNNLYAASRKGLFRSNLQYFGKDNRANIITMYSKDEPQITEVQQAAIRYAEVEPEKIMRWRKQAAKKALLPQLSVGLDRNVTDLWHWEGGSTTKTDDDILRKGHDSVEWDVTLSWDLGELIWNDDQTSIDVRSRLMVELRGDILDEVNKTYFERLRVKMELDSLSIEDRKKRYEKELRLQELSASLDALTGGYFSRQIKSKKDG